MNLLTYYVLDKIEQKKVKSAHLLCEFQGTMLQYIQKIYFRVGCYNFVNLFLTMHSLYTAAKDIFLDSLNKPWFSNTWKFWQVSDKEDVQLLQTSPTTLVASNTDDCTGQNFFKAQGSGFSTNPGH